MAKLERGGNSHSPHNSLTESIQAVIVQQESGRFLKTLHVSSSLLVEKHGLAYLRKPCVHIIAFNHKERRQKNSVSGVPKTPGRMMTGK